MYSTFARGTSRSVPPHARQDNSDLLSCDQEFLFELCELQSLTRISFPLYFYAKTEFRRSLCTTGEAMRIRKGVGNGWQAQIMVRFRFSFLVFLVAKLSAAQDDACGAHEGLNWQNFVFFISVFVFPRRGGPELFVSCPYVFPQSCMPFMLSV